MKKTLVAKRQIILARPAAQRAASDCLLICLWPRGKAAGRGRACVAAADGPPALFHAFAGKGVSENAFARICVHAINTWQISFRLWLRE
nr:hypothetical protein [uncultured Ottowia sp.]